MGFVFYLEEVPCKGTCKNELCNNKNDMVIIREDGGLYGYVGEKQNAEITISDEVKYIRENAFNSLFEFNFTEIFDKVGSA